MSRVVLISGGGSGIGAALTDRFAMADDHVVIVGRREHKLTATAENVRAKRPDASITTIGADVSSVQDVNRIITAVRKQFGTVDVLVANAGGHPTVANDDELEGLAKEWQANFASNVLSAVLLTEAARPLLATNARVVLFSSIAAYRGSGGTGAYGATKAALHGYLPVLAAALGPSGTTVNVIAPGYVAGTEFFGRQLPPERQEMLAKQAMTKRSGTPTDVVDFVEFLASPQAGHLTAQILQLNGGAERGR
jgi:3-oxoacyl-[acyl-carrier protein] reductase